MSLFGNLKTRKAFPKGDSAHTRVAGESFSERNRMGDRLSWAEHKERLGTKPKSKAIAKAKK